MVSLLEYGGLKPILPFLGGRSDAACRVVIKIVGLMGGGAWGMEWAWVRGGRGLRNAKIPPPAPSRTIMPIPCPPDCRPPMGIYGLYHDHGTPSLRSSRNGIAQLKPIYPKKTPHERLPPTGLLPQSPFWNTAVYNLFSRFSEDVATWSAASFKSLKKSLNHALLVEMRFTTTMRRAAPL